MKSGLISFAVTAALLTLGVLPSVWAVTPSPERSAFEERHSGENRTEVAARLGLREI
ncbi:MAG TPA: hypothetical protein VEZ70_07900 [Allosphingosinicella sp.]|nr:hypothetical protein [Allosphingosinicella sp.]